MGNKTSKVGDSVIVLGTDGCWHEGILSKKEEGKVLIQYGPSNEEWIPCDEYVKRLKEHREKESKIQKEEQEDKEQNEKEYRDFFQRTKIGESVDVMDTDRKWYEGVVLKKEDNRIFVHYVGWGDTWNEWFSYDQYGTRLAVFQTYAQDDTIKGRRVIEEKRMNAYFGIDENCVKNWIRIDSRLNGKTIVENIADINPAGKVFKEEFIPVIERMIERLKPQLENEERVLREWNSVKDRVSRLCPYKTPEEYKNWLFSVDEETMVSYSIKGKWYFGIVKEVHRKANRPYFVISRVEVSDRSTDTIGKTRPERVYHIYDSVSLDELDKEFIQRIYNRERSKEWEWLPFFDFENRLGDPLFREMAGLKYEEIEGNAPPLEELPTGNDPPPYQESVEPAKYTPPPKYKEETTIVV